MLLAEIAAASRDLAAMRARGAKVERIAACLRGLAPAEAPIAVAWLAGELPQGRVGAGWAAVRDATAAPPAAAPSLTIAEVDAALTALGGERGVGAAGERARRLGARFARATAEEQDFLRRLLVGELRQGALEGVMGEAVARAAGVAADAVRAALEAAEAHAALALAEARADAEREAAEREARLADALAAADAIADAATEAAVAHVVRWVMEAEP